MDTTTQTVLIIRDLTEGLSLEADVAGLHIGSEIDATPAPGGWNFFDALGLLFVPGDAAIGLPRSGSLV